MNDEYKCIQVGGDQLVVTIDRPAGASLGNVIIVPPFGMSADRIFPTAYFFVRNDFTVYRFDPRNHPGRSSGTIGHFTLSGLCEDVLSIMQLVPNSILVGISLSSRAVIRAMTLCDRWTSAVLITPVLNVRGTLRSVFGDDLFTRAEGDLSLYPTTNEILGYEVDMSFVLDCKTAAMEGLPDALADLVKCKNPITLISGTDDPWVCHSEVSATAAKARTKGADVRCRSVPAATHQLYRNPVLAMSYFHSAVTECLQLAGVTGKETQSPSFSEIIDAVSNLSRAKGGSTSHA